MQKLCLLQTRRERQKKKEKRKHPVLIFFFRKRVIPPRLIVHITFCRRDKLYIVLKTTFLRWKLSNAREFTCHHFPKCERLPLLYIFNIMVKDWRFLKLILFPSSVIFFWCSPPCMIFNVVSKCTLSWHHGGGGGLFINKE